MHLCTFIFLEQNVSFWVMWIPVIGTLFVPAIVLLNENRRMSFSLFLTLTTLVTPVGFLYHSGCLIEFPLLPIRQSKPTQVSLASVSRSRPTRTHVHPSFKFPLSSITILAIMAVATVELQLQLQELAEVCGYRWWRRRVRRQATARWTWWTRIGVHIRNGGSTAAALPIRVEQLTRV